MRMGVRGEGEVRRQTGMRTGMRMRVRMRMSADSHRVTVWVVLMRVSGRGASCARRLQVTRHIQAAREARNQFTRHVDVVITLLYRVTPSLMIARPPAVLHPVNSVVRVKWPPRAVLR